MPKLYCEIDEKKTDHKTKKMTDPHGIEQSVKICGVCKIVSHRTEKERIRVEGERDKVARAKIRQRELARKRQNRNPLKRVLRKVRR